MAFVFVTEDRILDAITEKSDRDKMKDIMDSAGDDVRWNINDKDRKNGKIVAWPLMASGKPTKANPTGTGAAAGGGMTQKGVNEYKRKNPGSKLKTAVTTPPSQLKKGSKAASRRKSFCARSRGWTGERGRAARRRWNC